MEMSVFLYGKSEMHKIGDGDKQQQGWFELRNNIVSVTSASE